MGKYEFIGLNFDDTDRDLKPGDYVDSLNLIPPKGGVATSAQRENVKGNVLISNALPTGENLCIGSYEDTTGNRLIFFIWNSTGKHGIYQFFYESNTISKIFEWSGLKFEKGKKINGVGVTDNLLYWCVEGQDLKMINIDRAINGEYNKQSQNEITVLKKPPSLPINTNRLRSSEEYNFIFDKSFQFAYRYVYLDNEVSAISPISKVSIGEYGSEPYGGLVNQEYSNTIRLLVNVDQDVLCILKNIEIYAREYNTGEFRLAKIVDIDRASTDQILSIAFSNDSIGVPLSSPESIKTIDSVPRISNSMSLFQGMIFTVADKEGFDVESSSFTFSASVGRSKQILFRDSEDDQSDFIFPPTRINRKFFKENGRYKLGIVFKDDGNRRSSVYSVTDINISPLRRKPYHEDDDRFLENGSALGVNKERPIINWSVSGKPPEWATWYSIVRTKELSYSKYYQFAARLEFVHEKPKWFEGRLINTGEEYRGLNGNEDFVYYKKPTSRGGLLHIKLPKNIPFMPEIGDEVRVIMDYNLTTPNTTYKITNIYGQYIEVEMFNFFTFLGNEHGRLAGGEWDTLNQVVMIEMFGRQISPLEEIYYDVGETYSVTNPGTPERSFSKVSGTLDGDTYYVFLKDDYEPFSVYYDDNIEINPNITKHIESPTPQLVDTSNLTNTHPDFATGTLDYSKSVSDIGHPNVVVSNEREMKRYTSIRYSNKFVQNSLINGYSSFDELNEYLLPIENGRVRKLIPAGGVLLAIHERYTSSLYINEGFLNTGDGQQFLSKTENIVGDDRTMQQSYGTINPESVDTHDGKAWWWDAHNGEVVRYANGLTPLASTYKAKSYFTKKSRERLKYKDQAKVYGAYHPYLDMYILTFAAVGEYPAETIAFSEKDKRWITRFSFAPEMYGKINTELVSFYKGNLWVHERNEVRNSFYGTSNNSEIEFVANDHPDYEKKFDNITLDASEPCDVEMSNSKGQVTDLIASEGEFKELGGNWYANILRDKNTPQIELGSNETPLHHGDEIISNTLKVKIKNNNNSPVTINNVKVGYKATSGQHINEK